MIQFFIEQTDFPIKRRGIKTHIRTCIKKLIEAENKKEGKINFIFCSDEYLLEINKQYLKHDYYTDIITFDYSIFPVVSGDMYISTDMVRRNAEEYAPSFEHELFRVLFHGVLHLCGYKDKLPNEEKLMREKENHYLHTNKINDEEYKKY